MRKRLFALAALLPLVVVAVVKSGGDDVPKETNPRIRPAHVDLGSADATMRDYRRARSAEKQRFVELYTEAHFGNAEPVAAMELRRHLDSQIGGLPTDGNRTDLVLAATGRTLLWDAAVRGAQILGWPAR